MPISTQIADIYKTKKHNTRSLLVLWKDDQLYYQAYIRAVNKIDQKCLVEFKDDGITSWIENKHIHAQLPKNFYERNLKLISDIQCVVCNETSDDTDKTNEVVMCDNCLQPYHQSCHEPKILDELKVEEADWSCKTCDYIWTQFEDSSQNQNIKSDIPLVKTCDGAENVVPEIKVKQESSVDKEKELQQRSEKDQQNDGQIQCLSKPTVCLHKFSEKRKAV